VPPLELWQQVLQSLGPTSAALLVCGLAIRKLAERYDAIQEKRIDEGKLAASAVLKLVDEQHEHMAAIIKALDGNSDAIEKLAPLLETISRRLEALEKVVGDSALRRTIGGGR
jgi:hypothetical protein